MTNAFISKQKNPLKAGLYRYSDIGRVYIHRDSVYLNPSSCLIMSMSLSI